MPVRVAFKWKKRGTSWPSELSLTQGNSPDRCERHPFSVGFHHSV